MRVASHAEDLVGVYFQCTNQGDPVSEIVPSSCIYLTLQHAHELIP